MPYKTEPSRAVRELVSAAQSCQQCPRMKASRRVLSELNGSWSARILFVGEAPGRLGAERTGIPMFGDRTGDRFEELLHAMRLTRSSVFTTNAILCNPRDKRGNNAPPSSIEISNCSGYLQTTIDLIDPAFVIALGRVALSALSLFAPHSLSLRSSAGQLFPWFGRYLGVLYHPGPRSVVHRSWDRQLADARNLLCHATLPRPSSAN